MPATSRRYDTHSKEHAELNLSDPLSAVTLRVSNVSVNFEPCAMKTKCLPVPPERLHECVHSSGHQYYINTLVPSPEMFSL